MKAGRFWVLWASVLALILLSVAFAPLLGHISPQLVAPTEQFTPPGEGHFLGTDHLGRDVWSRVLWGGRYSLASAALAALVALVLGTFFGGAAAASGFTIDWLIMRGADVLLAFPGLLLALAIVAILDTGLWQAAIAVGVSLAPTLSRLVRASILSVRSRPFIEASIVAGAGPVWIFRRHFLPNIAGQLISFTTVIYAWSLLHLSALDFLGVTGSPSTPTWGRMLAEGRTYLRVAPWLALAPGLLLTLSVVSVTGLSDAWRRSLTAGKRTL